MTSAREDARRAALALAQAEIRGEATRLQRQYVMCCLQHAGVGTRWMHEQIVDGRLAVRDLIQVAMTCTVVARCACGLDVSGAELLHLVAVASGPGWESRRCNGCGSGIRIEVPRRAA